MPPHHQYARLGRDGDRLPWRDRWFGEGSDHPGFELVDLFDSFVQRLLADGSIVLADPPPPSPPHVDP